MGDLIARILDMNNLRLAWDEMAENRGMPGVDNVSLRRWGRNWEERLVRLRDAVLSNRYRPSPLRTRRIPKADRTEWRTLRIPTVRDRVLQRAVYNVLCELYDPQFVECSFGYRPGRGLRDAVQRLLELRDGGLTWVLDADIDDFFNSVDHGLLLELLGQHTDDPITLRLIHSWLDVARVEPAEARGIPIGSPLSPLLANVYLHQLDVALCRARWQPVRYADDFVVCARTHRAAQRARAVTSRILASLRLCLEPRKTSITSFEEGFEFLGVRFYRDTYSYVWKDKRIQVDGDSVDWLFSRYGPQYE